MAEVLHLSVEFLLEAILVKYHLVLNSQILEDLTRLCEWKLMQGLTLDPASAMQLL